VTPFASDQYVILALMFVLGLVLGMYLLAGGKWKRRYKEEARLRAEMEKDNQRLRKQEAEWETLRASSAAARHPTAEHDTHAATPLTGTATQPEPRRGGLLGLGKAKH
jgi:uncharacterized membrane-anchored protein YhcB (DUF1043 family)